MSKQALEAFVETIKTGRSTAEAAARAIGEQTGEDATRALATFARERGFDVSETEMAAVFRSAQGAGHQDGDLADDELEGVAGGGWIIHEINKGTILG